MCDEEDMETDESCNTLCSVLYIEQMQLSRCLQTKVCLKYSKYFLSPGMITLCNNAHFLTVENEGEESP
jgi:hypothetical protein